MANSINIVLYRKILEAVLEEDLDHNVPDDKIFAAYPPKMPIVETGRYPDKYDDYIEKVRITMMLEEILGDYGVSNDYIVDEEMTILNTVGDVYEFVVYRINSEQEGGEKDMATVAKTWTTPQELRAKLDEILGITAREPGKKSMITKDIKDMTPEGLELYKKMTAAANEALGYAEDPAEFLEDGFLQKSLRDDLGADSLDTVETIMEIEKKFGIDIPDEEAEIFENIGGIYTYLCLIKGVIPFQSA